MLELTTDSRLDISTSLARHGFGLFETILVVDGRAPLLDLHIQRMSRGISFLRMQEPPGPDETKRFLQSETNIGDISRGILHLRAVDESVIVSLSPNMPTTPTSVGTGISKRVTRMSGNPLNAFKTMSYLDNALISREAEETGCFDLIAVNEKGSLSDGGRTNVFLLKEGRWVTPRLQDGALPGIARSVLLDAGIGIEAELTTLDIESCEAAFLTNALRGIIPVHAVGDLEKNPEQALFDRACSTFAKSIEMHR